MAYEIVDNERTTEFDSYMADVMQGNARRRRLLVQRPDPLQPAFSAEAETARQANAVTKANAAANGQEVPSRTAKSASGYEIVDGPKGDQGGYEIVDPEGSQAGKPIEGKKPFHPGQILDWVMSPVDPGASPSIMGEPPKPTVEPGKGFHPGQLIGHVGDIARELFHDVGSTAIDTVLTPGTYLLNPDVGMAPRPRVSGGGRPISPVTPSVDSVSTPAPGPMTSVQDLLRAEQERQLLAAQYQPRVGEGTVLETPYQVSQLPTGSILRHPLDPTTTVYGGPEYSTSPTGSQIHLTNPGQVSAEPGYPTGSPRYPIEPQTPQVKESFESKVLHGRGPEGPPKPPLKGAEDLLRPERPRPYPQTQQQRWEQRQREMPQPNGSVLQVPPEVPPLSLMDQPSQAGPRLSGVNVSAEGLPQHVPPRLIPRVFQHAYDVLDGLGPVAKNLSGILRYTFDYSEQGTRQNFLEATDLLKKQWGERSLLKGLKNNDSKLKALNSSVADFGMTQKESDAVIELIEAGLDNTRVTPAARATLPVDDPRVQAFAKDFWQIATGRASSHPAVQAHARVFDPITGEQIPVGPPSPYWPHQASGTRAKLKLTNEFLHDLYNRGQYSNKGIDFDTFKEKFSGWYNSDNPDIQLRKFAGLEYKRFLDTRKDALSHNRTVADSLRYYGYETDPLRMLVKHNMYALKRAATLEHGETIKQSMRMLQDEYGIDSPAYNWVRNVVNRSQGISRREDFINESSNIWNIAQSIAYPAFLRGSWKQNFLLQPNYLVMQSGLRPVVNAVWKYFGGKLGLSSQQIEEMASRSGATFPSFLAKYHSPEGVAQQYAKTALELDLFSPSDMATRKLSGMAGIPYTERIAKQFWKNPADPKWKGLLEELNINPAELYQDLAKASKETWENGLPPIPDKYLLRGAQVMANRSMGRTGIRSMQAWAAGDSELHHVMMMLHRQIASNEGLLVNSIVNAPTAGIGLKRALKILVGAEAAGLMYNGVVNSLTGNDFFDVNKSLVKTMGGNKEAALFAKSFLMGIGTFTSGIVLMGLNAMSGNIASPAYAFMSPPMASLADELINKAVRGDVPGVVKRLLPSEILSTTLQQQEREDRQRKRAGSSLPDPLRLP